MNLKRSYDEKRDFIRMRMDAPITLTVGENQRELNGRCIDLSGTGMCIEVDEPLDLGEEIVAFLPSHQAQFAPLHAAIRINRQKVDLDSYAYGAVITRILA